MKKILILGGAEAQVPLIEAAKKEGYYVVLCDWTTTNPGIALADKHYQVSTLDLPAVMEVAEKEHINGVISNSECAMQNVAAVSERFNLVGNSQDSVFKLQSKYEFRKLQKEIGLFSPEAFESDDLDCFIESAKKMKYPIIVKPSRSSASRGTTKIDVFSTEKITEAFQTCAEFSTNKKVTCEEFIEMPNGMNIEADIFIHNGKIIWDGIFTDVRLEKFPLIPCFDVYPSLMSEEQIQVFKKSIEAILKKADFRFGEINIEAFITSKNELFIIEINARQGGGVPPMIFDYCKIDMYRLLVSTCVGEDSYFNDVLLSEHESNNVISMPVFSEHDLIYNSLFIDDSISPYVYRVTEKIKKGEVVNKARTLCDTVATVCCKFPDRETQLMYSEKLSDLIKVNGEPIE